MKKQSKKLIFLIQNMVKLVINSIPNLYLEIQNFKIHLLYIILFQQIITQNRGTEFAEAGACSVRNTELSPPMTEVSHRTSHDRFLDSKNNKWTKNILK